MNLIIAIDGPSGAGKSTVAKRLASSLGLLYIDTGAMYRAVGLWALRTGVALDDAARLEQLAHQARIELRTHPERVFLNGEDITQAIRAPEVSDAASKVSAIAEVRRALVEKQRQLGAQGGVVMEGRDIGSVVFPNAQVKVFLHAGPQRSGRAPPARNYRKKEPVSLEDVARQCSNATKGDAPARTLPWSKLPMPLA
jgi:cytidylate kinase